MIRAENAYCLSSSLRDMDDNLQKAFHKYLEVRGIKASTTDFLHEYMLWSKNLKKFVAA